MPTTCLMTSLCLYRGAPLLAGGMDSRNHPMFAGPADALYTHFSGLTQASDSIGFEHVVFAPPTKLLALAAAGVVLNGNISQPLRLASVSKRTLRGTFKLSWHLPPAAPSVVTECAVHGYPNSGGLLYLGCPNPTLNKILGVKYAVWGVPASHHMISWCLCRPRPVILHQLGLGPCQIRSAVPT